MNERTHKWQVRVERTVVQYIDVCIYVKEGENPYEMAVQTIKQPLAPWAFSMGRSPKTLNWRLSKVERTQATDITQLDDRAYVPCDVLDLTIESSRLLENDK